MPKFIVVVKKTVTLQDAVVIEANSEEMIRDNIDLALMLAQRTGYSLEMIGQLPDKDFLEVSAHARLTEDGIERERHYQALANCKHTRAYLDDDGHGLMLWFCPDCQQHVPTP